MMHLVPRPVMVENRLSLKFIFQNFVEPRKEQRTVSGYLERMIEAFEEGKLTRHRNAG